MNCSPLNRSIVSGALQSLVSIACALCFGNILYWIPGLNGDGDRYAYAMFICVLTYLISKCWADRLVSVVRFADACISDNTLTADTMAITMANALPNSDMAFSIGGAIMTVWFGYAGFFVRLNKLVRACILHPPSIHAF